MEERREELAPRSRRGSFVVIDGYTLCEVEAVEVKCNMCLQTV